MKLDDRIIREPECRKLTGLCRTTRYIMENEGRFPRRVQLGGRAVGWKLSDVQEWIDSSPVVVSFNNSHQLTKDDLRMILFWENVAKIASLSIDNIKNGKDDLWDELKKSIKKEIDEAG